MNKKQVSGWMKQIDKRLTAMAKERDALDDIISKFQDLEEVYTKAMDSLTEARDALSEFV